MSDDGSVAAALAIIRNWSWERWDLRDGGLVSDWRSLNDAVNTLAFDGHADPAGAFLQLLIDGALIARGSYRWNACRNGDRFSQQDSGLISAHRWRCLRNKLGGTGQRITLPWLDMTNVIPVTWAWHNNSFILAHKTGNDQFSENYREEWFSAWDIEVHCPPAETGSARRDASFPVETNDCPSDKPAVPTVVRSSGRPPKYDWEGALAHIAAVANTPDGLDTGPGAQAAIERLIADYFARASDDGSAPCESEIRKRASRVMKAVEALNPSFSKVA